MPRPSIVNPRPRAALLFAAALLSPLLPGAGSAVWADDPPADSVGTIDGAAIAVSGPMRVDIVHGFVRTMLRSGSEVRVNSGTARLELIEGGFISICGPAHFSVLKSGRTLTVALDIGSIHAYIEHGAALTIYTPVIVAQTVSIGDAPQDALVGFDEAGAMCIRAYRGAVRLEQQLTGESVVVPQASGVLIVDGRLDGLQDGAERCSCDPQLTRYTPPPPAAATPQAPALEQVRVRPLQPAESDAPAPAGLPDTKEEPIYQVFMPPLVYDAKAKVQPEFDPQMIVLVRRVRVRPSLIFQGRVEGEELARKDPPSAKPGGAVAPMPGSAVPAVVSTAKPDTPRNESVANRVRNFVRKLWAR